MINKILQISLWVLLASMVPLAADEVPTALVIPHADLPRYGSNGNTLYGVSTPGLGAKQIEVWRSSIAPGSGTPLHQHDCEEVFIFFKGEGKVKINGEEVFYKAPCTVIIPADVDHEVLNTGDEPTDHVTILLIDSTLLDGDKRVLNLPWRK